MSEPKMSKHVVFPFRPVGMIEFCEAAVLVDEDEVRGERGTVGGHLRDVFDRAGWGDFGSRSTVFLGRNREYAFRNAPGA